MKKQIVVIHGGDTFETYDEYLRFLKDSKLNAEYLKRKNWKKSLQDKLGDEFEVIFPAMPNKQNAKYLEWKIWFEKLLPLFNDSLVLVGHSLGGLFLAKYVSENRLSKKILATFLIAAPFDDVDSEYTLTDFVLPDDLSLLEKQGGVITIYHSKDDPIVPFKDLSKYKTKLSQAKIVEFEDRGHFNQENFSELIDDIIQESKTE